MENEGWAGPALFNYSIAAVLVVLFIAVGFFLDGVDRLQIWGISALVLGIILNLLLYPFVNSFWLYIVYYWRKN